MSGALATIDLSLLPKPAVIEAVDFEALARQMLAKLAAGDPDFAEVLESDPAAKVLEAGAYGRMLDRQRVNEAALAVMLPYARGTDLDNLAALWNTARLQVGTDKAGRPVVEDDDRFRRRVRFAPETKGAAGSFGCYVYWAMTLAPAITDATAVQVSPGSVAVTMLGPGPRTVPATAASAAVATADGQPTAAELDAVRRAFSDPLTSKRPLTDSVAVAPPQVVGYRTVADIWILPGPDAELVMSKVRAAHAALLAERRKLGFDMPRSALDAALQQPGVSRVDLHEPAADVIVTPRQIAMQAGPPVLRVAGRTF